MLRKIYRQARKHAQKLAGEEYRAPKQLNIPCEHFGSEYGGWAVHTEGLGPDTIVYSCGLGGDISFDLEIIKRLGVQVHGFDPTPESIDFINAEPRPPQFHLHTWGIADTDGTVRFRKPLARPAGKKTISQNYSIIDAESSDGFIEVPVRRLKTIMQELGHDRIDILKLDIEGAEYAVLPDMLESGIRPKQLFMEVHHQFKTVTVDQTKRALKLLDDVGYKIFDVGASWHDYSFIRQD